MLLPETGLDEAVVAAERLRQAVHKIGLPALPELQVRVSIGVACGARLDDDEIDVLVAAADEALYQAKRAGRDRVVATAELAGSMVG